MRSALLLTVAFLPLQGCATSLYVDWMLRDNTRPEYVAEVRRSNADDAVVTVTKPWPSDQHVGAVFAAPFVLPFAFVWDVVTLPLQLFYRVGPFRPSQPDKPTTSG